MSKFFIVAGKVLGILGKWMLSQNKEKVEQVTEEVVLICREWATLPIKGIVKLLEKALHTCNKMINNIMNISPKKVTKWNILFLNAGLFLLLNLKHISEFFEYLTM